MNLKTISPADICLVAMPFLPVMSPSLGLSQLKAELSAQGILSDVVYPSLLFLELLSDLGTADTAELDYKLLASSTDLGETVFASALWDDPKLEILAAEAITQLLSSAEKNISTETITAAMARLLMVPALGSNFIEKVLISRDWGRYSVIGFSTVFSQSIASLALAKKIKTRFPHVTILFGGPNVDGGMGLSMMKHFQFIDVILRGEADTTLPQFLTSKNASSLVNIPGLLFRKGGKIVEGEPARPVFNLDARSIPDFSDFFNHVSILGPETIVPSRLVLPIETSRGCWWGSIKHCVFCGLNPTTIKYRSKSPDRVIEEFDTLAKRWKVKNFFAVDNIIDMEYFRQVLPILEGRDYNIFYETKSNLKEHHVAQLARAGVTSIQPGIESLNSDTLNLMNKGVKGVKNIELLKWCRLYDVDPLWFYLYGFPGEKPEQYLADIKFIPLLVHLPPPRNPNPILLDRFSPLFLDRKKKGFGKLIPPSNSAIYYSELDRDARCDLSYHFENRISTKVIAAYEDQLWKTICYWRDRSSAGAYLVHIEGENTTLVVDGRFRGYRHVTLLTCAAHKMHCALRTSRDINKLDLQPPPPAPGLEDMQLTLAAAAMNAKVVRVTDYSVALKIMLELGLVLEVDNLMLALSVDLLPGPFANSIGLNELTTRNLSPTPLVDHLQSVLTTW